MCFLVQGGSPPLHKASDQPPQKLPPGQPRVIERNRPEKRMFLLRKDIQVQLQPEKACGDFARGSDGALSHLWNPAEGPEDVEYALEKRSRENGSASLSWTWVHHDCSQFTSSEGFLRKQKCMIKKNTNKLAKLISLPLLGPYCSGAPWSSKVTLIIKIFSAWCGRYKFYFWIWILLCFRYVCSVCGKEHGYYKALKHCQDRHKGRFMHPCTLCDKKYLDKVRSKKSTNKTKITRWSWLCTCGSTLGKNLMLAQYVLPGWQG